MENITESVLIDFCTSVSGFCGREDVIHEVFCQSLYKAGLLNTELQREHQCGPIKKCDIVLIGDGKLSHAIEIKGGAYAHRNSLSELYRKYKREGEIADIENLEQCSENGIESWFICIDMPDLGRALDDGQAQELTQLCHSKNINFLYYCQKDKSAMIVIKGNIKTLKISKPEYSTINKSFKDVLSEAASSDFEFISNVDGHEANITSHLYNLARRSGLAVPQISLETYFVAASTGKRGGFYRPDMVLFESDFDGRFNLYNNGNVERNLDQHKMPSVRSLIEVKGGSSFRKQSPQKRLKDCLADAKKLNMWREIFSEHSSIELSFLVADSITKPMTKDLVEQIIANMPKNTLFVYVGANEKLIRQV